MVLSNGTGRCVEGDLWGSWDEFLFATCIRSQGQCVAYPGVDVGGAVVPDDGFYCECLEGYRHGNYWLRSSRCELSTAAFAAPLLVTMGLCSLSLASLCWRVDLRRVGVNWALAQGSISVFEKTAALFAVAIAALFVGCLVLLSVPADLDGIRITVSVPLFMVTIVSTFVATVEMLLGFVSTSAALQSTASLLAKGLARVLRAVVALCVVGTAVVLGIYHWGSSRTPLNRQDDELLLLAFVIFDTLVLVCVWLMGAVFMSKITDRLSRVLVQQMKASKELNKQADLDKFARIRKQLVRLKLCYYGAVASFIVLGTRSFFFAIRYGFVPFDGPSFLLIMNTPNVTSLGFLLVSSRKRRDSHKVVSGSPSSSHNSRIHSRGRPVQSKGAVAPISSAAPSSAALSVSQVTGTLSTSK